MVSSGVLTDGSGAMFDRIAKRYDLLNRLISFGLDRRWRRMLVDALGNLQEGDEVLDVATGTGDIALSIARRLPRVRVRGLDTSRGMLAVGERKVWVQRMSDRVVLAYGDAQSMPFEGDRFSASVIAFGIRNVPDRLQGLREMTRCVRPGGRVVVLELSEPRGGLLSALARLQVHYVVPWMGSLLSGAPEYRYLQRSIAAFPAPASFADLMTQAGLANVSYQRLTMGVAHLYVGEVPAIT